ncbi:hypothetical protein ACB098_08G023000 [Castanea mollissima]
MAMPAGGRKRKRKRTFATKRKLFVGQRVEVRSEEDGFQGSWHSATVIACYSQGRRVKYENILQDDGSKNFEADVPVSPALDGIGFANENSTYRGCIRPVPPRVELKKFGLPYGLCVDVFYQEAWWEGVIFDHDDGSHTRRIFFPDLGDELEIRINMLRITHEWNEVTENWQRRGTWLFLELIEEYEQEGGYLGVSVKQIWYDLRDKNGFEKIKEWTCMRKDLWKELVLEVINENLNIIINDVFQVLVCSEGLFQETNGVLESARTAVNVDISPGADLANSLAIVPVENSVCSNTLVDEEKCATAELISTLDINGSGTNTLADSDVPCHGKALCLVAESLSVLPSNPDGISSSNSMTISEDSTVISNKINGKPKCLTRRKTANWLPVGSDILPGAAFYPDAVTDYALGSTNSGISRNSLISNLRQHLSYLGWKIESWRDGNTLRLRYTSPDGKFYYSLRQVCQYMIGFTTEMISSIADNQKSVYVLPDDPSSTLLLEQKEDNQDPDYCHQTVMSSESDVFRVKPEFCPQAVVDYYMHPLDKRSKMLIEKARKHLSAVGWQMRYSYKRGKPEMRYISPRRRTYCSLRSACKCCMDEGTPESVASGCGSIQSTHAMEEDECQLGSDKSSSAASNAPSRRGSRESSSISQSIEKVQGKRKICGNRKGDFFHLASRSLRTQRNLKAMKDGSAIGFIGDEKLNSEDQNASLPKLKRRKVSGALIKLRDDLESSRLTRVLRSSKRIQKVVPPSTSHQTPRTILSWLIDNNVVLPRAKVNYCSRKKKKLMKEGRITRDGIKCSCCQMVFTLSGFGIHAGSKCQRPALSIFLEDGRSLLDCQMQIICDNKMGSSTGELPDRMQGNCHQGENDYICTVCHYGGELILCDQCPSAFHKICIGLKDVPDGDWFCPSCCCGICGKKKFGSNNADLVDDSILTCSQCEHKYHVGCLKNREVDKLENFPAENWFCCKKCEQIFLGLHKILENYSKLNIALDVMHECFEPVKESRTRRDLVEDVIFSRGSELNRLNFRGFYTVLLERNDEIISVATVRIHGEKVAEIPLVGTRFQYRRLGMCRILMNELEKKLMELEVERLILPAVPSVLNAWTTSFLFTKMTDSERLQFLDYTFLDFRDTVMCQKLLTKIPPAEPSPARGTQSKTVGLVCRNGDLDVPSVVSEVYQLEQIDERRIMEQGLVVYV